MAPSVPYLGYSRPVPIPEHPTRTTNTIASKSALFARQAPPTVTVTVPAPAPSDDSSTLNAGAIVGIVIGSVTGILLLIWIIRSCFNLGEPRQERESMYHYVKPERRHRHHSRHSSRPRRYSYTSEISIPSAVVFPDRTRTRSTQRRIIYEDVGRGRRHMRNI
ncbi:hypothetical protein E4U17_007976 [Claviceps sp. LM77 group G4]|nr:hypothetical protein E4U17_007976 [Claviceps sp. LM77 group G4]KAG6078598.1 hypothetical protein E4U16_001566 [Claviceps sp. LM84 group G4]KAG6084679.1 hypothetical protein E4U33_002993 [Claviceps sp. LM78 group G4]KAG6084695.1 hypothetical protein E4U33_003011 [Claviceps sp. LM78 group G4]